MEHKLIQGGEQYLPFARSRIKALRATGLRYASQQFEIDGVSIRVRIAGEHEYIDIAGGRATVLSGVIKGGELIDITVPPGTPPAKALRSYRPTENAWAVPLRKDPEKSAGAFNDEKFLNGAEQQYVDLAPSQFSGLMAKAVQIIMGRGTKVSYSPSWAICHGITVDSKGRPWLIEISDTNGVIAMRLPMDPPAKTSKNDAVKQASLLFGGVPNGGFFPAAGKLQSAIDAGTVLRLATVAEMSAYHLKTAYSEGLGWSFNSSGSEAHNTCFVGGGGSSIATGYHYRLNLAITIDGQGKASGTALLTEVSNGPVFAYAFGCSFVFSDERTGVAFFPSGPSSAALPLTLELTTVFVCHIDGVLEIVKHGRPPADSTIYTGDVVTYLKAGLGQPHGFISTTRFPSQGAASRVNVTETTGFTRTTAVYGGGDPSTLSSSTLLVEGTRKVEFSEDSPLQSGIWLSGSRDAYLMYVSSGSIRLTPKISYSTTHNYSVYGDIYTRNYSPPVDGVVMNEVVNLGPPSIPPNDSGNTYSTGAVVVVATGVRPFAEVLAEFTADYSDVVVFDSDTSPGSKTLVIEQVRVVGPVSSHDIPFSSFPNQSATRVSWESTLLETADVTSRSSIFGTGVNTVLSTDIAQPGKRVGIGTHISPFTLVDGTKYNFIGYI